MYTSLPKELYKIIDLARQAPSVHNVQPWRLEWTEPYLQVFVAANRILKDGDPTGRELWISMGAFIETIAAASEALGIDIEAKVTNNPVLGNPVMTVKLTQKNKTPQEDQLKAITGRASDRLQYSGTEIADELAEKFESVWKHANATISITTRKEDVSKIADLTSQGIAMALSLPGFRNELADLIRSNSSSARTGLFGYALGYGMFRSMLEPYLVRSGSGRIGQARREANAWARSAAIAAIFTPGDTAPFWLEAGRAYCRLGLAVTSAGLHLSTSAAAVEASDFHIEVETIMGQSGTRLQVLVRLGYADRTVKTSPRLTVQELFN